MASDDSVARRPSTMLFDSLALAFNFCAAVGIIFINKTIFSHMQFKFTTMLTAMHYVVTMVGLELLALFGVYEPRSSPTTPRLLLLQIRPTAQ